MLSSRLYKLYNKLSGVDPVQPDNNGEYVFHTLFDEEFRGRSPEEVIRALYENSRAGMNVDYDGWWDYQTKLWGQTFKQSVPAMGEDNDCLKLLSVMVKNGALETGPLPEKQIPSDERGLHVG